MEKPTPQSLLNWILSQSWFRQAEWYSLDIGVSPERAQEPLYSDGTWRVIAFWTPGANEGYYIHVGRVSSYHKNQNDRIMEPILTGKVWDKDAAALQVRALVQYLWDAGF